MVKEKRAVMKRVFLAMLFLFVVLFLAELVSSEDLASVTRDLPDRFVEGFLGDVYLNIDFNGDLGSRMFMLEEKIPAGWRLLNSSPEPFAYNIDTGQIYWLFSDELGLARQDSQIRYTVIPDWSRGEFSGSIIYFLNVDDMTGGLKESVSLGDNNFNLDYHVLDCIQLQRMNETLNASYGLVGNIDCSGMNFTPIGTNTRPFTGKFNGRGYVINNLTINSSMFTGLFGYTKNAEIINLGIENARVIGLGNTGILIGWMSGGIVKSSYSSGNINSCGINCGGLIGSVNIGTVSDCYSNANILRGGWRAGGLIGVLVGSLNNSYSIGNVSGGTYIGGLVGSSGTSIIENSFSTSKVSGTSSPGLFVGDHGGTIKNSYVFREAGNTMRVIGTERGRSNVSIVGARDYFFFNNLNKPMSSWDFDYIWMGREGYPVLNGNSVFSSSIPSASSRVTGRVIENIEANSKWSFFSWIKNVWDKYINWIN